MKMKNLRGLTAGTLAAMLCIAPAAIGSADGGDENYVYGTARLTWEQFWSGEELTYSEEQEFAAENEELDREGMNDLGGFDAVSRATSKHGVYRGSANYSILLNAADTEGNEVAVYLEDVADVANIEDMYGAGKELYGVTEEDTVSYYLVQPESGDFVTYTISDFKIVGYKAWPVKVLEGEAEAAAEAINFQEDENITEETGLLKTVSIDENGEVTVGAAAESAGLAVEYNGTPSVSYNDQYGDYVMIQLSECDPEWGMNLLGAVYEYYGETNPEENADAEPAATYGTKYAADDWWKSNGTLLQFGLNTSYRQNGSGVAGGEEQHGFWRITVMAAGYENYSFVVETLPAYENEVAVSLGEDNATLTVEGIDDTVWADTVVAVDGTVVEGFEAGAATVEEALTIGAHTVTVNIPEYREISAEVISMSGLAAEAITLTGNVLAVEGGDLANYISNITGIAVGETTLNGRNLGSTVFNEDGSINFEAAIAGRGGETIVFEKGSSESYMLIISSAGYPDVILTTEIAE